MKLRPYLLFSLLANLVLTGLVLFRAAEIGRLGHAGVHQLAISRTVTEIDLENPSPGPTPAVRAVAPPFNWRQIEASDYKVYIANLKAVQCPAATIRDIIVADVADQYTHRRSQALAMRQTEFWELVAKGGKGVQSAYNTPVDKLADEEAGLLKELLALIGPTGEVDRPVIDPYWRTLFDFLDPAKLEKAIAFELKYRELRDQLQKDLADDPAALQEKSKALAAEQKKELELLLSPSEMEEYLLRTSPEALWANNIRGAVPTDGEFHSVAKLMRDFDATHPAPDKNDPDAVAKEAARRGALDQQMRGLLGNLRFDELKRSMDGDYQLLFLITSRYQMPQEAANAAYRVKQASEQQLAQLDQQATLTDEDRQASIATIQTTAQRALQKALGDGGLQTYQRYGGAWLVNLGRY